MPIELTVNNVVTTVDAPPEMPLLWVLRDMLHIKGPKFGCGMGFAALARCMVGGEAVRSCMTAWEVWARTKITTIEGLSPDGLHPVQVAWEAIDVPQCGYCQAGQIMSAAALLKARRIRRTKRSTRPWRATCAAAEPIRGFVRPFTRRHRWARRLPQRSRQPRQRARQLRQSRRGCFHHGRGKLTTYRRTCDEDRSAIVSADERFGWRRAGAESLSFAADDSARANSSS